MNPIEGDPFAHREDFESCPYCYAQYENEEWYKYTVDVVRNHFRFPNVGASTVISECPKCFEKSWVHVSACWRLPEKFKQKAYDLREERR